MRITRFPSITELQFFGCVSAFVDSLEGELNAAGASLRRLEGQRKGAAFAYEMALDKHRYGALIVLDRWGAVLQAFGPHLQLSRDTAIVQDGPARIEAAGEVLHRSNQLLDAAEAYRADIVEACFLAFQSVRTTFADERSAADKSATLGPMLPEDHREARRIFLEDLAAR